MTLNELIVNAQKWADEGYGNKPILTENRELDLHIDSIQSNAHPTIEPDYLYIAPGPEADDVLRMIEKKEYLK